MGRVIGCGVLLFLFTIVPAFSAAPAPARWVHGSFVNVRATPSLKGDIVGKLTANTVVEFIEQQGDWCEVKTEQVGGFVSCALLGDKPLSLSEIGDKGPYDKPNPRYSPTRAFWLAPSVARLREAGDFFWRTMLPEAQKKREQPFDYGDQRGEGFDWKKTAIVRFAVPEFDAMKDLLQKGVVAAPELKPSIAKVSNLRAITVQPGAGGTVLDNRIWIPDGTLILLDSGRLRPVKPSLFKTVEDLAPPYASVEQLSAQFGVRERMRVLGGPEWAWFRHENPAVIGSWDIGTVQITMEQPVVEYVIGRTGLAAAMEWAATEKNQAAYEGDCTSGLGFAQHAKRLLPGYPKVKDPLLWFFVPKSLPYRNVSTRTYAKRLESLRGDKRDEQNYTLLVMHEVDIDKDGISDISVWEAMRATGDGDMVALRSSFANIGGEWYLLLAEEYQECT